MLLQEPDEGGIFEYVRQARPANDASEDAALVKRVLSGEQKPEQANVRAGSVVLIRGNEHLHRVTPVHGVLPRVLAVLSYESTPGVTLNEYTRLKILADARKTRGLHNIWRFQRHQTLLFLRLFAIVIRMRTFKRELV